MLKRFLYPILFGLLIGIVTSLIVLLLLSAFAVSFDIPSFLVVPLAISANAFGAFSCAFSSAKKGKQNGWLLGLVSAVLLYLITTVAGFGLYDSVDGTFLLIKALIMMACGMVGGIIAVNTQKRKKR